MLDLGRLFAAPWCAQMLGDLGADVIKIERPERGDEFRHYGPPFLQDEEGRDTLESSYFLTANRNKRSVTVDFSVGAGADLVRRLAAEADVLIENYRVGVLAKYGLDYESIRGINPALIYCSVTGFGQDGPYAHRPATDSVLQALSGLMSVTGDPAGEPQKVGVVIVDLLTGVYAANAVLAALRHREVQGGGGQHIDMALLDVGVAAMSHRAMDFLLSGTIPTRSGNRTSGTAPAQIFECRDGSINIQAGTEEAFRALCDILDLQDLALDPRYRTRIDRVRNADTLIPVLSVAVGAWAVRPLFERLCDAGIISSPIYTFDQAVSDPHVTHRGLVGAVSHTSGREIPNLISPIRLSETPISTYAAAPTLGQHTDEILTSLLGLDASELEELRRTKVI